MFAHLHEKAKLSIFTEEFFVSEASQRHERHERPGGTDRRGAGAACRDGRKTALIKKNWRPLFNPLRRENCIFTTDTPKNGGAK